ncbi:MAG: hypothetical protein QOF87_727 [Pseudonocardiales bacterium]|jgi:hypothetical protein|nr:hypothetical protein [Pseudonocardiales bacterium]MDT4910793.1 hypothetical protein [Pseudonocardiales bacterium]MDT4956670.1 hypothetical protein [Pseudonocardiales bacterium]MDT4961080.1 hypothetical protein [Pseudonocardiales bacterium]MDT4970641.1 hypothetical protein [Pseudonocardiales bacterium]
MALFRRREAQPAPPAEAEPDDSPDALRRALTQLVAFINQNAGKLPGESVVAARQVTDTVRDVIDTSNDGELDVYAIISVKGIVNDYLPTTLRTYLALDPQVVDVRRPTGRTPKESLLDQIISLWAGAADVLTAAQAKDADALVSQGNFLQTKFTGSDLDL